MPETAQFQLYNLNGKSHRIFCSTYSIESDFIFIPLAFGMGVRDGSVAICPPPTAISDPSTPVN